jgi:hypothetical protein
MGEERADHRFHHGLLIEAFLSLPIAKQEAKEIKANKEAVDVSWQQA